MKYLVNRETKEHVIYGAEVDDHLQWDVVDADDEGWIKWDGKEWDCPLPDNARCDLKWRNNPDDIDINKKAGAGWAWKQSIVGGNFVEAYRPILPAESKPEHQRVLDEFKSPFGPCPPDAEPTDNVFKRFNAAVAASESIPALIAEINAMLPDRFEIVEKAKIKKIAEDMSDWKKWEIGDIVTCLNGDGWENFKRGCKYEITGLSGIGVKIQDTHVNEHICDFKFHSRPVTK